MDYIIAFNSIQKQQIIDKYGLDGGRTQKVIDSAFIGYLEPYVPMDENHELVGKLLSNKPGKGEIDIDAHHAHYQYEGIKYIDPKYKIGAFYDKNSGRYWSRPGIKKVQSNERLNYHSGPLRGDHFVERMLADHFDDILNAGQKEIDK